MPAHRPDACAKRPSEVMVVLMAAGMTFAISQTLTMPALPALADEFDTSAASASWTMTGFLLAASVATPLVGKLGDLYGKGRMLTAVLLAFSAGAVVCALAPSIEWVIVGRVLQGAAGGVFPLAFGIIRDTFPRERVAGAIGLLSTSFGIGGGVGLPLAGVIVDHAAIAWLFWIGLLALPAALAAHRLVPPSPTVERTRIDWPGAALLSLALVGLLLGVTKANDWGWGAPTTLALLIGGLLVLVLWLRVEARQREPLVNLGVLRQRAVAMTNLAGLLIGFAMFSSFLLLLRFAQAPEHTGYGFGLSTVEAGALMIPSSLLMLLGGPLAGRIGARIGFRTTLATGAALATTSFTLLALEHSAPWQLVLAGCFLGPGMAFGLASMANLIVNAVPQSQVGIATGINTITRTIGGAFGTAVSTAVLAGSTLDGSNLPTEGAYTTAFAISAVGGVLAITAAFLLPGPPARPSDGVVDARQPEAAPG